MGTAGLSLYAQFYLGWARLDWVELDKAGLGWAGLVWAGVGIEGFMNAT